MGKKKGGKRITARQMSEKLQQLFQEYSGETLSFKQIFKLLRLDTHPAKMLAVDMMEEMAWDDFLTKVSDNQYRLNDKGQVQEGTFVRKSNGKNSVLPDGSEKPVFVAERNSMFALDGDRVRVQFLARRKNHIKEAMVTEVIERKRTEFVGKVRVQKDFAYLLAPSLMLPHDIIIAKKKLKGAESGDKAVVRITQWPDREHRHLQGEVIAVLGREGDNNTEMHAILAEYGLPYEYPAKVEEAANRISGEITAQDYAEREDFRDVYTCTIDPKDAKDFDDALSLRKLDNGLWEVGVHIADVSHYVKEGDIIDREAQQRATSIYLVDRTIPMLPERLCNFVCSLRPDEEKLAYSAIFEMDANANVKRWHLAHTVIKSNRRFCYEEAQVIIDNEKARLASGKPASVSLSTTNEATCEDDVVNIMWLLASQLREKRFKNGAIKFDREELRFEIDATGKPIRCYYKKSLEANKLVEEFMLLANRSVAEMIGNPAKKNGKKPSPKVLPYRVHDNPDPVKLEELKNFVVKFGLKLKTGGTKSETARSLNSLMDSVNGSKQQKLVELVALRAMMKAKYTVHNIGHFGLAFDYYTHFTSPIRRYPDTMVHRLLTKYQEGGRSANKDHCEELCKHSSDMEVVATQAERDSIKYKMVEYMGQFLGKEFDAHISGITSYGIYCEIDDNHCEGMVPMRDLDNDYYDFDEKNYQLVGRRHHNRYQLGDAVRIKVARANVDKRQLDFTLVN